MSHSKIFCCVLLLEFVFVVLVVSVVFVVLVMVLVVSACDSCIYNTAPRHTHQFSGTYCIIEMLT